MLPKSELDQAKNSCIIDNLKRLSTLHYLS
uniref:Uncharacterized protein n=1 Tax=Anguilla anguilla TaxID=7936 RepID=A0A0E9SD02_ANGAN